MSRYMQTADEREVAFRDEATGDLRPAVSVKQLADEVGVTPAAIRMGIGRGIVPPGFVYQGVLFFWKDDADKIIAEARLRGTKYRRNRLKGN